MQKRTHGPKIFFRADILCGDIFVTLFMVSAREDFVEAMFVLDDKPYMTLGGISSASLRLYFLSASIRFSRQGMDKSSPMRIAGIWRCSVSPQSSHRPCRDFVCCRHLLPHIIQGDNSTKQRSAAPRCALEKSSDL